MFERFGKYLILDHLVDGGMAKICRARFLGEQANKLVAIKMVQPQFTKDASFVQMFEDELKVTFSLIHPNIAQMYDYGIVKGQLFTAMEYVDGANLKQYLDRLKSKNYVFPVEISTYIISQVCQGLHYAHTYQDKMTGKKLNIVHRDISPHNIMLTYDGAIKVIDFGIAKADSNREATQAGTIKGKLSYLAPEYLDGLELDPRYDEFAVGITLWEMLCGRKLFSASNDLAVLKQIQACKIPNPSTINPNVPKELDAIVMKALAKDRNQRFEDMDQFNRALVRFLYSHYPNFNATDLGFFAKQLFKEEIEADRKKFVEYGKIDIRPYLEELKHDNEVGVPEQAGIKIHQTRKIDINIDASKIDATGIVLEKTEVRKFPTKITKRDDGLQLDKKDKTRSGRTKSRIEAQQVEDDVQKKSPLIKIVASIAVVAGVYFGFIDKKDLLNLDKERQVASVADDITETETGVLTLKGFDSTTMTIFVNNEKKSIAGSSLNVPLDIDLTIRVEKRGYFPFEKKNIIVSKENRAVVINVPALVEEKVGFLSSSQNYTAGSKLIFKVNGEVMEKDLPVENLRVPAGSYEGVIRNPVLDTEKVVQFVIEENKRVYLEQ